MDKCCDTCKHDIGGFCRMNLEYECRAGEGYEAWEEDVKASVTLENLMEKDDLFPNERSATE